MSLHRRHDAGKKALDVIHPSGDLSLSVPKYKIPPRRTFAADRLCSWSTMSCCSTATRARTSRPSAPPGWSPRRKRCMAECIDKNMCDKDEYPQTAEIESRCVHIMADLWNSPDAANTIGCSTTGSSEAAMLGGLAAKWRWRREAARAGQSQSTSRIWSAERCRSAGTNSAATSMSKSAKSRSKATVC